jgi:hypothetical protein
MPQKTHPKSVLIPNPTVGFRLNQDTMTKQFLEYVIPMPSRWRRDARIHVETIGFLSNGCTRIPMINGWPCQVKTWKNAWRFWIGDQKGFPQRAIRFLKRRISRQEPDFGTHFKYNYQSWFNSLQKHERFRAILNDITSLVPEVFDREGLENLIRQATEGKLAPAHYVFLGKILSLAVACDITRKGEGYTGVHTKKEMPLMK